MLSSDEVEINGSCFVPRPWLGSCFVFSRLLVRMSARRLTFLTEAVFFAVSLGASGRISRLDYQIGHGSVLSLFYLFLYTLLDASQCLQ